MNNAIREKTMCDAQNSLNRQRHFDYLRVFATFSVMILHISAQNWYGTDVNGMQWQTFNFYDSIVRWGGADFCYD